MKSVSRFQSQRIVNLLLFSISLIPVLLFVFITVQRIGLPIDLEWGEGAGLNQIERILSGRALYAEPSLEFSPLVYTPLYYFVSAALGGIVKPVYLAARLISVFSTIASAILLFVLVGKRTEEPLAGWISTALYIACFSLCDGYFDLVRVDAFFVLIALAGFSVFLHGRSVLHYLAGGFLIVVGFFVKQSAVIVFFPLAIYLMVRDWKKAWVLLPVVLIGILTPIFITNYLTEGWFGYYLFALPREHGFSLLSAVGFWTGDLMRHLGIALGISAAYWIFKGEKNALSEKAAGADMAPAKRILGNFPPGDETLIALFALGAVLGSWVTRSSNGGGLNNLMVGYAAIALVFGLGANRVLQSTRNWKKEGAKLKLLITILIGIQFLGLYYNPFDFIPTTDEITANQILVGMIEQTDGDVLIPYRSDVPARAGKQASIHAVNLFELTGYFLGEVQPAGKAIIRQIQENICEQGYNIIVLDQPIPWFQTQIDLAYTKYARRLMPADGRRSAQLAWQEGYNQVFVPLDSYSQDLCWESISSQEK